MFDGPEHESYRELMRELRLEREFEEGDYCVWWSDLRNPPLVHLIDQAAAIERHRAVYSYGPGNHAHRAWLPRLDQWLSMLEEAGFRDIGFVRLATEWLVALMDGAGESSELRTWAGQGRGASREEAAARLWMAVTGREVPAAGDQGA